MNRRDYLKILPVATLSGCSSQSQADATETRTQSSPTQTMTPTPTPTPEAPAPAVSAVNLLSHWTEYGDVISNEMEAVGTGGFANIGLRYTLATHDGKSEEFVQVTVYHDGSSVDSQTETDTRLSDEDQVESSWEWSFVFNTSNWEQGTYNAEAIVRDEISGKNSDPIEIEFEVVEPLGPDEVELVEVIRPPQVQAGQPVSYDLRLQNTSERDSSIVSTLSGRYENSQWGSVSDEKFRFNLPAGETRTFEGGQVTFDRSGTYEYRLDDIDASWTISVTE